ncbi:Ecp14-1 [Fulvia fulva]|uniref:Ecp14-1 n=1 Tax=Passalora fulva TaxID=5499 RepID=A0A1P8YXM9_PASFU|nr:Ecp14-1 [Fulvia fulva]AQA29258.1 extracellular protein 14-1 [Fulvia fulva]KAK4624825.1 Ecp14-1 [Fulvia fulva]UJO17283.1 Ecp14-1 [Fulvia fulva]
MYTMQILSGLGLIASLAHATPRDLGVSRQQGGRPICTDGGELRCCGAVFNGDNAPVELLTELSCYDLTPATTNCILTETTPDADGSCPGYWQCCHVLLDPLLGLYCGPPPGPCQGQEAPPRCLDIINGRFGVCPASSPLKGLLDTDGKYTPGSGRFVAHKVSGPGGAGEDPLTGLGLDGLLPGITGLLNGRDLSSLDGGEAEVPSK